MNNKEKADKYDELVEKSGNGDDVIDIEGQKWLRMHPEMEKWMESHSLRTFLLILNKSWTVIFLINKIQIQYNNNGDLMIS